MRSFVRCSVLALLLAVPATSFAAAWDFDTAHTNIGFAVKHMMVSTVHGRFSKFSGVINLDDADPTKSTVEVTVDVSSIGTNNDKRDGHLRSPDFFDVAKNPTMLFKSTKVEKAADGYTVTGNLTIRGVTKPVVLTVSGPTKPMKDPMGTMHVGFSATGKINRKDFGLVWNKPLESGGLLVGDDVALELDGELIPKK